MKVIASNCRYLYQQRIVALRQTEGCSKNEHGSKMNLDLGFNLTWHLVLWHIDLPCYPRMRQYTQGFLKADFAKQQSHSELRLSDPKLEGCSSQLKERIGIITYYYNYMTHLSHPS